VARDASPTQENRALLAVVRSLVAIGDAEVTVVLQKGGALVDEMASITATVVAADLSRWAPAAVFERLIGRMGFRALAGRVRGHRLGLGRLGRGDAVYLHTVMVVQALRYLPRAVPVLCRVPESVYPLRQPLSSTDVRLLVDRVTRFLTVTSAGVDDLVAVHGVAPERVVRMREAVVAPVAGDRPAEGPALRTRLGFGDEAVVVGIFGDAAVEIHPPCLPLAVAIRRHPDSDAVVLLLVVPEHTAGPWARHDIEYAGLADRVAIVELVGSPPAYLDVCDVVVHAWWGADQPLAYLEAAAAGIPLVCSEGHELAELVGDDEGGYVCPRLDLPAMAAGVVALAAQPVERREKGAVAAARAAARYAPTDAAGRLWQQVLEVRVCMPS